MRRRVLVWLALGVWLCPVVGAWGRPSGEGGASNRGSGKSGGFYKLARPAPLDTPVTLPANQRKQATRITFIQGDTDTNFVVVGSGRMKPLMLTIKVPATAATVPSVYDPHLNCDTFARGTGRITISESDGLAAQAKSYNYTIN